MSKKNALMSLAIVFLLSGCSAFRAIIPVELKDGRQGYSINCSNNVKGWGLCLENAKNICKGGDFQILNTFGEGVTSDGRFQYGPWDSYTARAMVIVCEN